MFNFKRFFGFGKKKSDKFPVVDYASKIAVAREVLKSMGIEDIKPLIKRKKSNDA